MSGKYLKSSTSYMNPYSGSVNFGSEWEKEFEERDNSLFQTWEEWGGDQLVEVEFCANCGWTEVEA